MWFQVGFTFCVEIPRAHLYCKYIKTNSERINIYIFLRWGKKCGKDHEAEKPVFLRAPPSLHSQNAGVHSHAFPF